MNITRCKRGTGRTHNMISAAVIYAAEHGQSVVVMGDDKDLEVSVRNYCNTPEFDEWRLTCDAHLQTRRSTARLTFKNHRTGESFTVAFLSAKNVNIEWYQFRIIGTDQKETFFDHHAIELKFAEVLDRWSKYDHPANKASCKAAQEFFDNERRKAESP